MTAEAPELKALFDRILETEPQQRLRVVQDHGEAAQLLGQFVSYAEQMLIADLDLSGRIAQFVVELADELAHAPLQTASRRALAQAFAYGNRFDEALTVLDVAMRLADSAGNATEGARVAMSRQHALARLGRYDEAIATGIAAREAFRAAGEVMLVAKADANLGVIYRMRDDPRAALARFDAALAAMQYEPLSLAQVQSNRAEALLDLNRFAEAEEAFNAALEAFRRANVKRAAAIVEGNLADLMNRQGRLERALYFFERARRFMESESSAGDLARLLAEQAEALAGSGMFDDALHNYERAIPQLQEHGMVWEAARAQAGQARVQIRRGDFAQAQATLQAAGKKFESLAHHAGLGRVQLLEGEVAAAHGQLTKARECFESAAKLLCDRPADVALVDLRLALLAIQQREFQLAQQHTEAAMKTASALHLAPLSADILHARSVIHAATGEAEASLADQRAAIEQIERVRGSLQTDRLRAAFLGSRTTVYEELVGSLLDKGDAASHAEAFHVVERSKSRSLLDIVHGAIDVIERASNNVSDRAEASLLQQMVKVKSDLNALYSRVFEIQRHEPQATAAADANIPQAIERHERQLHELEHRLAATQGVGRLFAPPAQADEVLAILPADAALIEYFMTGGQLGAFVMHQHQLHVVRNLMTEESLHALLDQLMFQIDRAVGWASHQSTIDPALTVDVQRELRELHRAIMAPLLAHTGSAQRLMIVPHGPLHAMSFSALFDGQAYLIQQREIVHWLSASLLVFLRRSRRCVPPGCFNALVVGVPDDAAPAIAQEVRTVAEALPRARVLEHEDATLAALKGIVAQADLVHMACHGRFVPENPLSSGVRLADGWLTARDIYAMKLNGPVVTLSGCETARTAVSTGDELSGLIRAFFAAGASSLLVSHFTLHDESAAKVMALFYKLWHNERSPNGSRLSAALRHAQCQVMQEHPHPAFWAPFALVGEV